MFSGTFSSKRSASGTLRAAALAALAATAGCFNASSQNGAVDTPRDAGEVLSRLAQAYRGAASYSDNGRLRYRVVGTRQGIDETVDFSVSLERPNKMALHVYQATVVSDGNKFNAVLADLAGQVLDLPAPKQLQLTDIYSVPYLGDVLTGGIAGGSVQLVLLLDDKMFLDDILRTAEKPKLLAPKEAHGDLCHRVAVDRADGTLVLWVDQKTFALRRVEYPTDGLRASLGSELGEISSVSLVADLRGARLNPALGRDAFRIQVPPDARPVVQFNLAPPLLGKKISEFTFKGLDGRTITRESLAGKVAVIDFFNTTSDWCSKDLPNLDSVAELHATDQVTFLAVSIDDSSVTDVQLADALKKAGVSLPIARNVGNSARDAFQIEGVPTILILGPDGTVQDYEKGYRPRLADELPGKLQKLLAGSDLYPDVLGQYAFSGQGDEIIRAELAPRSEPTALALSPLWTCDQVKKPGNLLIVARQPGDRVIVLDGWQAIAELDDQGVVSDSVELSLPSAAGEAVISYLRTAVDKDSRRWYIGCGASQQQLHVFDEQWKRVCSFPSQGDHAGISDVQLGDLDDDGQPEIFVGYWGVVGVHGVSLDGRRLWATRRSLQDVLRLAVGPIDARGTRGLLTAHGQGWLQAIDRRGQPGRAVHVANRLLRSVHAADLDGDRQVEICALAYTRPGIDELVGIDAAGNELWSYPLPNGVQHNPALEMICHGPLAAGGPDHWIVAAGDGSIHFLSGSGTLIDRFNYGSAPSGLAAGTLAGQPALVIASGDKVEAWRIEN